MNGLRYSCLAVLIVALAGCASGNRQPRVAPMHVHRVNNGQPVFHDEEIKTKLIKAGASFMESAQATPMDVLQSQLKRRYCSLELTKQNRRKLSVEEIGERGREGVVVVGSLYHCGKCDSWHLTTGTGFILSESGAIATCHHVVNDPTHKTVVVMTSNGRIYPVKEVLAADETNDIAILRIEAPGLTPVALSTQARVGSRVFVLGHPEEKFYSFTEGIVSRYFTGQEETGDATMMSITADFGLGSSGCPIFNDFGAVVGMADNIVSTVSAVDGGKAKAGIVFKHCRPAAAILDLIRPSHVAGKANDRQVKLARQ